MQKNGVSQSKRASECQSKKQSHLSELAGNLRKGGRLLGRKIGERGSVRRIGR